MASFNFPTDMLGPKLATAQVGGGMETGGALTNDGNLQGLSSALENPTPRESVSLNTPASSIGVSNDQINLWGKLKAGLGKKVGGEGSLTLGQHVGLSAVSAGLQTVAKLGEINREHDAAMEAMRDDFDRQFANIEYESLRYRTAKEAQDTKDVIARIHAIKKQTQGMASQTRENQTQQFTRDPRTGGLL